MKPAPPAPGVAATATVAPALFVLAGLICAGCQSFRYQNEAAFLGPELPVSHQTDWSEYFINSYVVPARDVVTLDPLWRAATGGEAWNADDDGVPDSSFYTNRRPEDLTPESVARGPCIDSPPEAPFKVLKPKPEGVTPGFIGTDAHGRKYVVKLDDAHYPNLGSSASIIGSRIFWALGYNVPAEYITTVGGTGDPEMDGRRASASEFIEHGRGHLCIDCVRHRREIRGLRLASAWVNDVDRNDTNTLVVVEDDRALCYLVDFNSALGSWQGRPKDPWRGYRAAGDLPVIVLGIISFGLVTGEPDPNQPIISPAVGRFEAEDFRPLSWRPQWRNSAFEHMTSSDMRWMAGKIAEIERPQIEAIVAEARYDDPADAACIVNTLTERRAKILDLLERS